MTTIAISDVEYLYLDQIADLIAYARNPQVDTDPEDISYALSLITANEEVNNAAAAKTLKLRHPGTHGPFPMELGLERAVVLVPDVVAFLAGYGISLVREAQEQTSQPHAEPAPVVIASDGPSQLPAVPNWKMQVQAEATAYCLRLRKAGANPTRNSILEPMAKWCRDNDIKTETKIHPSSNYLRTHVLGGKYWEVPN